MKELVRYIWILLIVKSIGVKEGVVFSLMHLIVTGNEVDVGIGCVHFHLIIKIIMP